MNGRPRKQCWARNPFPSNSRCNSNAQKFSSSTKHRETVVPIFPREKRQARISVGDCKNLRNVLIDRIEKIILGVIEEVRSGKLPKIFYRVTSIESLMKQIESMDSRLMENKNYDDFTENPDSGICENFGDESAEFSAQKHVVSFGAIRSQSTFALIMVTLKKIHQLLIAERTETRRSFFYELKSNEATAKIIKSQSQVDRIVNIIGKLLNCHPSDMALVASAKGLGSGDLIITLRNNEKIDYRKSGAVLIPTIVSNIIFIASRANFVLIVEKDAIFQKLIEENCPSTLNCFLITGKGYPDVATRMLVKILAEKLKLPVYVLVDADPYGIEIMFIYKYGSINFSYEHGNLACPTARWLGLLPSDCESFEIPKIPLTDFDLAKLALINSRPYVTDRFSKELRIMRSGKAEIEAIITGRENQDLTSFYISKKIRSSNYL